jgi:hypothetical protein
LRVAVGGRPPKSLEGLCGTIYLCGVPLDQMAKVELLETVRKVSEMPVACPYRGPKMPFSANFGPLIMPESTLGALLRPFSDSLGR